MIKHHGNSVGTDDDYVLYHTRALMTLGLFRLYHNKLISVGDGKRLMSLYRLMYVWCHNLGLKNYALGLLELQFQLAVLPEHMRVSLIQNRFVNFAGKVDTNHPVDLVVEHENKFFKQNIKTYRGDFTQNALDKVTKASNVTKAMKKNLKQSTGLRQKDVGTHTSKDPRPDVLALVNQFRGDSLFEDIPSRSYKNLFVHPNVFKINRSELLYFVTKNVKTFKTMHYYRYVNTVNLG